MECDGDDMAVHNVGGPERRANAPLAQLVESIRLISERSPVQARQGARFTPRGAYSINRKSVTIATQVSVREDMRPFQIDKFKSTTYDKEKPSMALEDIPGH